jgi:YHS domain-containing protein
MFGKTAGEIEDDLVKDPFCEVYFSKRDGVHLKVDGEDLHFCSPECRDKFIASHSKT